LDLPLDRATCRRQMLSRACVHDMPRLARPRHGGPGLRSLSAPAASLKGARAVWYFRHGASGNNSVVECDLAKVEVAGSNPVSRSNFLPSSSPDHSSSRLPGGQFSQGLLTTLLSAGFCRRILSWRTSSSSALGTFSKPLLRQLEQVRTVLLRGCWATLTCGYSGLSG
jgi:hypothetical protein